MANCVIKPSFLRGFDLELLYTMDGIEEYRLMSHNPLTGSLYVAPWGNSNILRSTDGGRTFEKINDVLFGLGNSNYGYFSAYGISRHAFLFSNSGTGATSNVNIYATVIDEGSIVAPLNANLQVGNNTIGQMYPWSLGYANGAFAFGASVLGYGSSTSAGTQWRDSAFELTYGSTGGTGVNDLRNYILYGGLTRGAWYYGFGVYGGYANSSLDMGTVKDFRRTPMPRTGSTGGSEVISTLSSPVEIIDVKDYTGVVPDGAIAMERSGKIWATDATELSSWAEGGAVPADVVDSHFPHVAVGRGRFGELVVMSIDTSGSKGLLTQDHGATMRAFDLPSDLGLILPGGICPTQGAAINQPSRVYDIKYITDPETNHTTGRWIFCAGRAIFEMKPIYGE